MNKKKRPTSVTVIAWIVIVTSGLGLVATLLTSTMPEVQQMLKATGMSVATAILWAVVAGVIGVVSGIAILNGLNWGRLLYLCFVPISTILGWVLYGFRLMHIPSVIFYIIVLVFLTRPAASTFFGSGGSAGSKSEE